MFTCVMSRGFPLIQAAAIVVALVLPLAACARREGDEQAALAALTLRAEQGNDAFISGDMHAWYATVSPISEDFTLMSPFGDFSRGFDGSDARLDRMAQMFTGGAATFELIAQYGGGDVAVLVFIERQRAVVGGLPEQDWSLRVTQVYRRNGATWELVHRHADPIANGIELERAAEIAAAD